MDNHFGIGLMAGLNSKQPFNAQTIERYCEDFKRGYVIGYSHHLIETTRDAELATRVAGSLTREYGLDRETMMDVYTEFQQGSSASSFLFGYTVTAQSLDGESLKS